LIRGSSISSCTKNNRTMQPKEYFEIEYISPSILRCGRYDFHLEYREGTQRLDFSGREEGDGSHGFLGFPSEAEWNKNYSSWQGEKREVIQNRIIEWSRHWQHTLFLEQVLCSHYILESVPDDYKFTSDSKSFMHRIKRCKEGGYDCAVSQNRNIKLILLGIESYGAEADWIYIFQYYEHQIRITKGIGSKFEILYWHAWDGLARAEIIYINSELTKAYHIFLSKLFKHTDVAIKDINVSVSMPATSKDEIVDPQDLIGMVCKAVGSKKHTKPLRRIIKDILWLILIAFVTALALCIIQNR
jgi:hypothetical protein